MNRILVTLFCVAVFVFSVPFIAAVTDQAKQKAPWETAEFGSGSAKDVLAAAAEIKPKKYAKVTVLLDERRVSFDAQQRTRQISRYVYRIEDQSAVQSWGTTQATWSPWLQERPEIRARVIAPDGTITQLDPQVLTETTVHDQRPAIYEDQRALSGPIPNVQVGCIVEEELSWRDTAVAISQGTVRRFYVGTGSPTEQTRLIVTLPETLPFQYRLRGGADVQVKQERKDGMLTVTFEKGPMEALQELEHDLPADAESRPMIDYSTAPSWNAVAAEYYADIEPAIQPSQVAVLLEGTKGLSGEQLLRRLVTNLHQKIRYTGMEFGRSAIIPHKPGETLKTGYGDCKDKAVVLVSALKALGIQANVALLNTRGDTDVTPELPGLSQFDHAIVYIPGTVPTWIDATAEYFQPGILPWSDQGRLALIVDKNTKTLLRIPILKPEQNMERSVREFVLSENGPAKVTETLQGVGPEDATYRNDYGHIEGKETREFLERYAKSAFLAESLDDVSYSGPGADLTKPFQFKLVMNKAPRGSSDMASAAVAFPNYGLMWNYPNWILDDDGTDKPETPGWKPRKNDVETIPFSTEWTYKIVPPPGFDAPVLPKDDEVKFGPAATLVRQYKVEKDGSLTAIWRFSSGKARLTPAELKEFQKALHSFTNRGVTLATFRQKGAALLSQGKAKEALEVYRGLIALHPNEALHHLQISMALLDSGFGEAARIEGKRATELDPKDPEAWNIYAWILQHDAIGRRFGKGFDRDGSLAAYRKAIELNPKTWNYVADYAILLEHNSYGERYESGSDLEGAAKNYRLLQTINKEKAESYSNNLAFALLYARKWKDAIDYCASTPKEPARTAITITAIAEQEGASAAIAEAERMESSDADRSKRLVNAANLLVRLRDYKAAVELLRAAEPGQSDKSDIRGRIQKLQNTRKYEELLFPATDPRYPMQNYFLFLLDAHAKPEDLYLYTEPDDDRKTELEANSRAGRNLRRYLDREGQQTADEMRDDVLSGLKFNVEGDDAQGYRLRVRAFGDVKHNFFVVKRQAGYKVIGEDRDIALIGREVLDILKRGDLKTAKHWLDWAREEMTLNSGDDPLAGYVFPRFWSRDDEAEAQRMRLAAIALYSHSSGVREYIPELIALRAKSTGDTADRLDLLLASAATNAKDWKALVEVAPRLFASHPDSDTALRYLQTAAIFGKQPTLGDKGVAQRLAKRDDDLTALRMAAAMAESKLDFKAARQILRTNILDKNRAEMNDFNQYTWLALFTDQVTDQDVELLQNAISADNNSRYAEIHTLACLYAEQGKTKDARELLLAAMNAGGLEEPDSSIWFGFGRIAEQFGLADVARSYYKKVDGSSEEMEMPSSTFNLARKREKILADSVRQAGTAKHIAAR